MAYRQKFNELMELAENHYLYIDGFIYVPNKYQPQFKDLFEELSIYFEEYPNYKEILTFLQLKRDARSPDTTKAQYFEKFRRDFEEVVAEAEEEVSNDDTSYESSDDENSLCVQSPLNSFGNTSSESSDSSDEDDFEWIKRKVRSRDASPTRDDPIVSSRQPNPPARNDTVPVKLRRGPRPEDGRTTYQGDDPIVYRTMFTDNNIVDEPQHEVAINDSIGPVQNTTTAPNFVQLWELQRASRLKTFLRKEYSFRDAAVVALGFLNEATCEQISKFVNKRMCRKCISRNISRVMREDRFVLRGYMVYKERLFVHPVQDDYIVRSQYYVTNIGSMRGFVYSLSKIGNELYEKLVE